MNSNNEAEKERLKFFLDKYFQLILERDRLIIIVIQLLIALLVIASFSEKVIVNINFIKILIIILLFLIPIMLIDYVLKLNNGLTSFAKNLGDKSEENKNFFKKIVDGSNYIYVLVICAIIDSLIWNIIPCSKIAYILILFHLIFISSVGYCLFSKRKIV